MMKRIVATTLALAIVFACVQIADARGGRGGGGMRGGGMRSSGMSRPSTGMSRPSTGMSRPSGGFDLNRDTMRPVARPGEGAGAGGIQRPPGGLERPAGGVERPPIGSGGNRPSTPIQRPPNARPPVQPPVPPGPAWGWNGGVVWAPVPTYWGGGFWGPWAWGMTTAVVFGEIVNEETNEKETSYEVSPDSPGAKTLAAYHLTQTQCGPANLVVIRGPENSVVCAQPNETVAAGEYYLDATNLTIYSKS